MKANMLDYEYCNDEETATFRKQKAQNQPLPKGVFWNKDESIYYKVDPSELTPENVQLLSSFVQIEYLQAIKKWVAFFGILTILGLVGSLIALIAR